MRVKKSVQTFLEKQSLEKKYTSTPQRRKISGHRRSPILFAILYGFILGSLVFILLNIWVKVLLIKYM